MPKIVPFKMPQAPRTVEVGPPGAQPLSDAHKMKLFNGLVAYFRAHPHGEPAGSAGDTEALVDGLLSEKERMQLIFGKAYDPVTGILHLDSVGMCLPPSHLPNR